MPDVVIWMMSGDKRIAYHRIPAYDLLYSPHFEARGKHCGKTMDLFMKVIFSQGELRCSLIQQIPGDLHTLCTWRLVLSKKLQLWINVLGQICTFDIFSHTPDKQSCANTNSLAYLLSPLHIHC